MAQVKFYSKTSLPTGDNLDENGVYFIQGGELYKGAQRFGLGRVSIVANEAGLSSIEDPARGDIAATAGGAAWVYAGSGEGEGWKVIGGDTKSLQSLWRSDIKSWTSGLVQSGTGSYITGITQDADGKVTAAASNFATDVLTAVGDGDASSTANGITVSVTTTSGSVTGVSVSASQITCETVTASSATFTDLTVTSTADFEVTNIVASSLTVNGSTVEQIADKQIAAIASVTQTGTSNGVTVSVTTSGGSVTAVSVDATAFGNVMRFRGVYASTASVSDASAGDIIVIGSEPTGGAVAGQEYICTAAATTDPQADAQWELIGDQNTYAINAYTSTASVYTGVKTVPGALNAAGAAIDTLNTDIATKASLGTSTSTSSGITGTVTLASDAAPVVTMAVNVAELKTALGLGTAAYVNVANAVTSTGTDLPTESAVYTFVDTTIGSLDSTVTSTSGNVGVSITQTDGKLTACTVTFDWIED